MVTSASPCLNTCHPGYQQQRPCWRCWALQSRQLSLVLALQNGISAGKRTGDSSSHVEGAEHSSQDSCHLCLLFRMTSMQGAEHSSQDSYHLCLLFRMASLLGRGLVTAATMLKVLSTPVKTVVTCACSSEWHLCWEVDWWQQQPCWRCWALQSRQLSLVLALQNGISAGKRTDDSSGHVEGAEHSSQDSCHLCLLFRMTSMLGRGLVTAVAKLKVLSIWVKSVATFCPCSSEWHLCWEEDWW